MMNRLLLLIIVVIVVLHSVKGITTTITTLGVILLLLSRSHYIPPYSYINITNDTTTITTLIYNIANDNCTSFLPFP
jgi:hypothetical protein